MNRRRTYRFLASVFNGSPFARASPRQYEDVAPLDLVLQRWFLWKNQWKTPQDLEAEAIRIGLCGLHGGAADRSSALPP